MLTTQTQDRIFKIRGKRTYYLPWQGNGNWRETNNDMELAVADETKEMIYDELFWSSDDEAESSNDMELTLAENDKIKEMNQDELFWSSSDSEDDDMTDESASVDKEGNNCSVDEQEVAEGSHATVDINGERNNKIEHITSDRVRVH